MINTSDYIKTGWEKFKDNYGTVLLRAFLMFLLSASFGFVMSYFLKDANVLKYVLKTILDTFIQIFLLMTFINVFDDTQRGCISDFLTFIRFMLSNFLYGIIVIVGLLLFVFPGIYLGIRLQFIFYLLLDKEMSIKEAFSTSWKMTEEKSWDLFCFGLLIICFNVLGALCLLVGLAVTIPVSTLAVIGLYRELESQSAIPSNGTKTAELPAGPLR